VGITSGSLDIDNAIEGASNLSFNDRLDVIPFLIRLGKRTIRTAQFNTALTIAINLIFTALANPIRYEEFGFSNFADVRLTIIKNKTG